ncbi:MAG: Hsp20/alpha crystallin family protein [Bryobacteraceae bacterium]
MNVFLLSPARQAEWCPSADIYQTHWGWILKFDLAGVRMEDIQVVIASHSITVSGVRRDYMLEEGCSYYSMEISYSRFERTIELPVELEGATFRMDYRDGILMVRISLREEQPR